MINPPAAHNKIARRAYEFFEARGRQHGHDWDDWFRAERDILRPPRTDTAPPPSRIVFLFGAGASYGATHVEPERPPLMIELFDRLADEYPKQWGPSSPQWQYRDRFKADFEQTFSEVIIRPAPFTVDSLTLSETLWTIGRYFAQFRTARGGDDCYSKLLAALARHDRLDSAVFASLNYDCLFEQAAELMGNHVEWCILGLNEPRTLPEPHKGRIRTLKLHGSCNFAAHIDQHTRAMLASRTLVEMRFRPLWPLELAGQFASMDPQAVLLVVSPLAFDKQPVLAPGAMYGLRQLWEVAVRAADCLVIIGVSCNVHDRHITNAVRSAGTVLYVGGDANFAAWAGVNTNATHVGYKFESSLPELFGRLGVS